ncbi:C4-dicarboxylate ABC transporter, partial [Dolichospermum sp. ST_sed10]|nr:C4-dicarboxylate ABC transporter [Dolichospermum sp. ST_sed10]
GDLLFLKCLFSLYMSVFKLTLIFHLCNFPLEQFGVRNVG